MNRPRIAITMDDPAGTGPELCLHLNDAAIATELAAMLPGVLDRAFKGAR